MRCAKLKNQSCINRKININYLLRNLKKTRMQIFKRNITKKKCYRRRHPYQKNNCQRPSFKIHSSRQRWNAVTRFAMKYMPRGTDQVQLSTSTFIVFFQLFQLFSDCSSQRSSNCMNAHAHTILSHLLQCCLFNS